MFFAEEVAPWDPSILFQYGAVGVIAALGVLFVRNAYTRETKRADEAQAEIARLNQLLRDKDATIQDRFLPALLETQTALRESASLLSELLSAGIRKAGR